MMNTIAENNTEVSTKASKKLASAMEILALIVISLVALAIVLWFRAQLDDQAIANFDDCKKLYGTVQGNPYQCKTLNGDTYEVEP